MHEYSDQSQRELQAEADCQLPVWVWVCVTGVEREREMERVCRAEGRAATVTGIPVGGCCRAHFLTVNIAGRTKPL